MVIGVPREIKEDEYRVSVVPAGVRRLCRSGHRVLVKKSAGWYSGITDQMYRDAGAELFSRAEDIYAEADMIVKVKEPQPSEYGLIRKGQIVFTFFHFAANEVLTRAMIESGSVCIAYETIQASNGSLPLLTPMSEVAGRMAVQEGAKYLERPAGGRGVLLAGVPGVLPANVLILGGGVVGTNAAKVAAGLGAQVTIMDVDVDRLRYLDDVMPGNVNTLYSDPLRIRQKLRDADLVIGAVLVRGAKAPVLITREALRVMKPGAVIVDVAVDQGGCVETTHPTTHRDPVYTVDKIVHYAVANIPGAVPCTSTYALTNVTLPYVQKIADLGYRQACTEDAGIAVGVNIAEGQVMLKEIAEQYSLSSHV